MTAPYRGYEEGGSVGLATGFAKGILGVALKPAIGVFDAVSRTAEGIKNSTFSSGRTEGSYMRRSRRPRYRTDLYSMCCTRYLFVVSD